LRQIATRDASAKAEEILDARAAPGLSTDRHHFDD
jgi:hypothetical protein